MLNARNRCSPFTARQWQELEHQALIFKYMTYGMPVPPDLLYPIRRGWDSIPISPTLPRLFPQHPTGWGCLQMGFGRKAADPEPGRCRRTDGKKWRCSKEAYPDSKYCERHMHRGRNRSRKPVELTSTPTPSTSSPTPPSLSSSLTSSSSLSSSSSHIPTQTPHPFLYPHSSSSRTPAISLPNQNSTTHFNLDSSSYSSADKDYRYLHGLKEDVDEHAFFSEASGSLRSIPNSNLDSSWRSIQRNSSVLPSSYYSQQQQQQHCFVLGSDFKSGSRAVKVERDEEPQQPLRLFFDEWPPPPPKNRDSWLDLQEDQSDRATSSTTQLSMSIPVASSLFPTGNSRSRNDD